MTVQHPQNGARPEVDRSRPVTFDLTHRADPARLPELMDEPCSYETLRDTLCDLARLNRLLLAYTPTLRFLAKALPCKVSEPVRILDVGAGAGDTLRRVARWAYRHHRPVQLAGIDLNPNATRAARELTPVRKPFQNIHWQTADLFTLPLSPPPDLVLSSLVTHHMRDDEIIRFLRWQEAHARRGWFISDLLRSPRSYALYRPLSRLLRLHPYVQHDGLVSIRRAFREPDWHRLLAAANIPPHAVQLQRSGRGRLCLTRLK